LNNRVNVTRFENVLRFQNHPKFGQGFALSAIYRQVKTCNNTADEAKPRLNKTGLLKAFSLLHIES